MPASFRRYRFALTAMLASCALAVALPAATPEPELQELETAVAEADAVWPLRDYLEFPRYDNVVISPDGAHLATGWGEDNYQRRVSILAFPALKTLRSSVLQMHYGVTDLRWLDNRNLLIQPDWPLRGLRRLREPLGTMLVKNIDGRTLHELNSVPNGTVDAFVGLRSREQRAITGKHGPNAYGPVRAVATRSSATGQLLFQTLWVGQGSNDGGYGIFELDLHGKKQARVALLPLRTGKVVTGPGNRAALVAGVNAADEQVVYYLAEDARSTGRNWQLLARGRSGERGLSPVAWTGNDEEYYALDGRDSPTRAVVAWNARDNTQRLLYRNPDADMDAVALDPSGRPWMFSGVRDFPVYWYPDPQHPLARLHQALAQRLEHEYVEVMSATDDLSTAVVRISAGDRPTMFLVMDVAAARSLTGMDSFPRLRGRRLSPVNAIRFQARDGLTIRGYLTTPLDQDGERRRGLPLLVIAHDGPRGEGADNRYEVERQVFASRGYAVLQVNVRGSGGRGVAFEHAGDGRWGREVQDDFADAVRWAIRDGVAAAGQVCFYGSGYGAYSAMLAAAREPELFQCVVGLAGIYDLPRIAETMPTGKKGGTTAIDNHELPLMLRRAFGGRMAEFESRSAVSHAAAIKARVLLVQQLLDERAPPNQLDAMAKALRAAGNRPRVITIGGDAQGYMEPGSRTAAYKQIVDFLDDQIGH
jgi:dipeptidyl aminopeptidase/acylaminoacyl peptidase